MDKIDIRDSLSKLVFDNQGLFIMAEPSINSRSQVSSGPNMRVKFYAGVAIENSQRVQLCLWIQDTKLRKFTQRDLTILKDLANWIGYVFSTSTKITSRDAQKLIGVQKELSVKNRQLAEANARRKAMLENIGDGVVGINDKGEIIYINLAICNLTGWSHEELIGKPFLHTFILETEDGKEVDVVNRPIRNAMYNNQKVESNKYYLRRKNGSRFAVSVTATPVSLFEQIIGGVTVTRDITREREIDKMKTEFISLASHQLRTPLSSMKWFSEMLLDGDAGQISDEQKDIVESIYVSNERMIQLVNTLLNISRIESGRIIIDPKPTDLGKLVKEVVDGLKNRVEEKKQVVNFHIPEPLPTINIDPELIRHVYMNLLTNALKYSGEGGKIDIQITKSGNEIISKIHDNGMGIPADEQDKVFSKFFRGKNVVKVETDGSGLGLYLVYTIVQSSGGKIWFESEEGKGTEFTFVLPLAGTKPKQGEVRVS